MTRTKSEQARFDNMKDLKPKSKMPHFNWQRVDVKSANECWPWIGTLNTWGYGACQFGGKSVNASRAAYMDTFGPLQAGLVVCHRCDNPACCNPAHLWADTQANNLADCRAKGRAVFKRGKDHHRTNAKLTAERVIEARRLYAEGVSQSEMGRRWGINSSCISRALSSKTWKHVDG